MNTGSLHGEGDEILDDDSENLSDYSYTCGCDLVVHPADLQLHCLSCLYFQPVISLPKITDPQIFIASGLIPPRNLSLRIRKKRFKSSFAISLAEIPLSFIMSEGGVDFETNGEEEGHDESPLSTPPPAVMSFQVEEAKPIISEIPMDTSGSNHGSEEDDASQANGILSPQDDASKNGEDKAMDSMLDELLAASTTVEPSVSEALYESSPTDVVSSKEEGEKEKDGSGSELNSLLDEMLEDKEEKSGSHNSPESTPPPQAPTIRMRPMLDLMKSRLNDEKVEEPFAALNDLVNNLQGPPGPPPPPDQASMMKPSPGNHKGHGEGVRNTHHGEDMWKNLQQMGNPVVGAKRQRTSDSDGELSMQPYPPHNSLKNDSLTLQPLTSITSHPPPPMMASPQVTLQKRPPQPAFPPGITMTRQPSYAHRRDSDGSSSSSSHSPTPTASPRLPEGITLVKSGQKASDPVASMLATRGVSVVPSSREPQQAVSITKTTPKSSILSNSNSALTITATPPKRPRTSPIMTTVDLTDDSAPPIRRPPPMPQVASLQPRAPTMNRGRPPSATCDVCDKVFANAEALRIHMQTHAPGRRGVGPPMGPLRPPLRHPATPNFPVKAGVFECEVCTARYQTQQQLMQHTQRFHPDRFGGSVGHQFALPVVDLNDSMTPNMLANLGIKYCIPLSDLQQSNGSPGHYAMPLIAMDGAVNPAVCNLDHMRCSNLLPLGTMKAVRRH